MNPIRLMCVATTATVLVACGGSHAKQTTDVSSAAPELPHVEQVLPEVARTVLVIDHTSSTTVRSADVMLDVQREIARAYGAAGGAGSYLTVSAFGGGPTDAESIDDFEICRGGKRRCGDEAAQSERVARMNSRVAELLADPPSVGGSDPVGFLYHLLSQFRDGFAENPTSVVVWSDFVSRSDVLLLDGTTDISTVEARSAVIDALTAKGLDFSTIDLRGVAIDVRLVPTDISAQSSVYGGFLRSFVEELLARTGATVSVSLFTSTDA